VILSEVKFEDYVPENMEFYKRATEVPFINELIRKFSVIFKFEGLFYSKRVHQEKIQKRNELYGILQKNGLNKEPTNSEKNVSNLI
jgi:hypothetical protein